MQATIITKPDCSYCVRAKMLLDQKKIPYTELKLGEDITRAEVTDLYPIMKTVPIILLSDGPDGSDHLIGGYTQLNQLLNENTHD
jgi:glutaredoxin 3